MVGNDIIEGKWTGGTYQCLLREDCSLGVLSIIRETLHTLQKTRGTARVLTVDTPGNSKMGVRVKTSQTPKTPKKKKKKKNING